MSTTNILDLNNRIDALEKNSGGGGSADSAKRSDIATEFSATTAYTAGCFVYYEGNLYQFNADHAAGAWDPTDVVEANVTDQVVSNASAIAGLTASYPAAKVMLSDDVTSVEDALGGSKLTDVTDWAENSSYPSGTALTPANWIWIAHKVLPAGIYYISGMVNLSTGSTTAISLVQQIRDSTHDKVLTSDSVTAQQRSLPSSCMVALTEPTDIYFDVYVGGTASVYARNFNAIKLF